MTKRKVDKKVKPVHKRKEVVEEAGPTVAQIWYTTGIVIVIIGVLTQLAVVLFS